MAKKVKLSIDKLKVGMILARDINDPNTGELVAAKNVTLDDDAIYKLKMFLINQTTLEDDSMAMLDASVIEELSPAEQERQYYNKFKESYEKSHEIVDYHLRKVAEGNAPDLNQLSDIIEEIFSSIRFKSDAFAYLNHLGLRDDYIHEHSLSVATVSRVFADWLKMKKDETDLLVAAALLHDVGMMSIPQNIVNKNGKLTDEEFEKIRNHTIYGYNLLKGHDLPEDVKYAALQHHERIDGSGYPAGLNGKQICKFAKIIAIADVFTAMICERPYRKKKDAFDVIRTFEREYMSVLDTEFLMSFLQNIAYNYVNRKVMLTNGQVGTVVFINKAQYSSPIVSLEDGTYVDLMFNKKLSIAETL